MAMEKRLDRDNEEEEEDRFAILGGKSLNISEETKQKCNELLKLCKGLEMYCSPLYAIPFPLL